MKLFKKTASVVLAMTMTAMLATTALAAEEPIEPATEAAGAKLDVSEHTYVAYQIFSGTQAAENNSVLCDIEWGANIDGKSFLAKLQEKDATSYGTCKTAEDVAKVLATFANDSEKAREFAELADQYKTGTGTDIGVTSTIDEKVTTPGYYLVVDTTKTNGGEDTAKNLSLLQLTKNTSLDITSKTDIPKVEKKVYEESFKEANQVGKITGYSLETGYNDVADYDIGDDVPFMLIGTMPTTLDDYDTYKYAFYDTLSTAFTYNSDAKIYLDNGEGQVEIKSDCYSVVEDKDKNEFKFSFDDVKSIQDKDGNALTVTEESKIIVKYTAELDDDAVIGLDGNLNTVYLEYSNNPNFIGTGDSGDDSGDDNGDDDGDDDGNKDKDETGKTPEDKVIVFTYELDVTKENTDEEAVKDAEFTLQNESGLYYNKDAEGVRWVESKDDATVLTSDANGKFVVKGIDDGTYTLTETKAPIGYNKLKEAITLTITAVTVNNQDWDDFIASKALTALSIKVDDVNATAGNGSVDTGIVDMTVINSKGSLLPETGGIGTVAIYTVGTLLVVVAGVLLVTKKRMSK